MNERPRKSDSMQQTCDLILVARSNVQDIVEGLQNVRENIVQSLSSSSLPAVRDLPLDPSSIQPRIAPQSEVDIVDSELEGFSSSLCEVADVLDHCAQSLQQQKRPLSSSSQLSSPRMMVVSRDQAALIRELERSRDALQSDLDKLRAHAEADKRRFRQHVESQAATAVNIQMQRLQLQTERVRLKMAADSQTEFEQRRSRELAQSKQEFESVLEQQRLAYESKIRHLQSLFDACHAEACRFEQTLMEERVQAVCERQAAVEENEQALRAEFKQREEVIATHLAEQLLEQFRSEKAQLCHELEQAAESELRRITLEFEAEKLRCMALIDDRDREIETLRAEISQRLLMQSSTTQSRAAEEHPKTVPLPPFLGLEGVRPCIFDQPP